MTSTSSIVGTPEYWAQQTPDQIAVISEDLQMTYAEWNERADRVAEGLAALGLRAGDRIGMRFRLSLEWFVVQRALQKLGVAQVAVNWKLTADEAEYILRDSAARGLACNDTNIAGWAGKDLEFLVTVGQESGSAGIRYEDLVTTPDPTERFGPARPNMVLYTSGTTGAPKGVPPLDLAEADLNTLQRYMTSVASVPPNPPAAITLLTLPIHHGAGPAAAAAASSGGGTVVLLDPYRPEEALRLIDKHRVQVWVSVPTMLLRIRALPAEVLDRYDTSSLSVVGVGAAAVPQTLKEWTVARFGESVLWESYGSSETGPVSYTSPEFQLTKPGTSGRPYDCVDIAIVDDDWNRLAPGVAGVVAVRTPIVIDHYLGRDKLGDNVIRDGYFRTGDVGHLDEDGFLFITDRAADMIVAGGVNIYPAEIEKVLVQHPAVVDCAVIGIPEPTFGEQPLAFVVAVPSSDLTVEDLTAFLADKLARFKHPRQFVFVEGLPTNPTGKVLKNELRAPYWEQYDRKI